MAIRGLDQALIERVNDYIGDPTGWCYVVSEALYYYLGGKDAGLKPMQLSWETENGTHFSHWWLVDKDNEVIDLTADQFEIDYEFPYHQGKGRGFMPKMKADSVKLLEWLQE